MLNILAMVLPPAGGPARLGEATAATRISTIKLSLAAAEEASISIAPDAGLYVMCMAARWAASGSYLPIMISQRIYIAEALRVYS